MLYCTRCSRPVRADHANCPGCLHPLRVGAQAEEARSTWMRLPESARAQFQADYEKRLRDWEKEHDFFEIRSLRKHTWAGAIAFGGAGILTGSWALVYALFGLVAGRMLSRRRGGIFSGIVAGIAVFASASLLYYALLGFLPIDSLTMLFNLGRFNLAARFVGLICPGVGGLLGYMIEEEFDRHG